MIKVILSIMIVYGVSKELELQQFTYLTSNSFSSSEGSNLTLWLGWSCSKGVKITNCGSYHLLGGYDAFSNASVSKDINNLYDHIKLRVKALIMKIDSWDSEYIQLWADGVKVFQKQFQTPDGSQICGWDNYFTEFSYTSNELAYQLDVTFAHTANSVKLEFKDTLDQGPEDESWGIRDIKISVIFECPSECDQTSCELKA